MAVEKIHIQIVSLFSVVTNVVNVVGGSSKRHDILHNKQVEVVVESLKDCELSSGQGLNQELNVLVIHVGVHIRYFT